MLRKAFNVKHSLAANSVTLTPNTGEGFKVTNIHCTPNAAVTEFLTIQIDRMTVGYIHVGTGILNQLPLQESSESMVTIFDQLKFKGYDLSYPIPDGSTLTITAANNWARLSIDYEIWDTNDIKSTDLNGSASKEYIFLQYGSYDTAITAAGTYTLNKVHNPVEFPNFPFGDPVPSKATMEVLGIGCPAHIMSGATYATDWVASTYLRLYKEREVLFDEDRNGLLIFADTAVPGANTTMYYDSSFSELPYGGLGTYKPLRILPQPLLFGANEELSVQMTIVLAASGATMAASAMYVCMPIRVKRL